MNFLGRQNLGAFLAWYVTSLALFRHVPTDVQMKRAKFLFFCLHMYPKISKCFFVVNCLGIFFFTCLFVFSQIKRIHSASRLNDDTIKIRKKKKRTSNIKFADKWKELKRAINRCFQRYVYSNFGIIMEFI